MKHSIVIIGAGMAGLSLAALLARRGMKVTVVDREDPQAMATETFDSRTVALSAGTRAILAPLEIWDELAPHTQAITAIDVQEGHDPFLLNFDIKDHSGEALACLSSASGSAKDMAFGWILPNSMVRRVLYEAARQHGVTFVQDGLQAISFPVSPSKDGVHSSARQPVVTRRNGPPPARGKSGEGWVTLTLQSGAEIAASLLIGADGRHSRVRALCGIDTVDLDYKQTALVGLVTHDKPHFGLAVERFYPDGPFAVLPFTDDAAGRHRSAIVWTRHNKRRLPVPPLAAVTQAIAPFFDDRYGAVDAIGTWAAFPLTLHHAKTFIADRVVLISDAAHAIHPIAGQGLNLGMRDVAWLAEHLPDAAKRSSSKSGRASMHDPGDAALLQRYDRARRLDAFAMIAATDLLNRLFGNALPGLRLLRSAGLGAVNRIPRLKRFFTGVAMGQK